MKELTDNDYATINAAAAAAIKKFAVKGCAYSQYNPFLFALDISRSNGAAKAVGCANAIFHALGVLDDARDLALGEADSHCALCVSEDGKSYTVLFNHPRALAFKPSDEEYAFTIKAFSEREEAEAEAEEAEMKALVEGIRTGRLKSKSADGYLVLASEFYDAIEAGEKTVEYRDFTEYNIKRTIGLKTIRFSRGYGSKGKPPKQMQWKVKSVVLMDGDENTCDPCNVPKDFWPVTIAIKLGSRIG